jgi:membrane protease YdiL (CAAX protease family)
MATVPAPSPRNVYENDRINWKAIAALIIMPIMLVLAFVVSAVPGVPRELSAFITASLEVVPFVLLAVLAYIGTRRDWGKVLTFIWLLLLVGGIALNNISTAFAALIENFTSTTALPTLVPGGGFRLALIGGLSFLAVVLSALGFLPSVRRWLSRFLPLDPQSFVHTIALVSIVATTLLSVIPLLVLQAPPTLEALTNVPEFGEAAAQSTGVSNLVYRLVWAVPGAILAVGYAVRRDLGEALRRLGFVRPTLAQLALGVGVGALLVGVIFALDPAINWLWTLLGWPVTDGEAFNELLEPILNAGILGAVVLGVVAGVSEELAVRGVLQPRLGIVLSNLLFTAVHALQYNWDALLIVFLLGLVFGVLRKRTTTTTSAIAHGVYDLILVLLQVFAPQLGQ